MIKGKDIYELNIEARKFKCTTIPTHRKEDEYAKALNGKRHFKDDRF